MPTPQLPGFGDIGAFIRWKKSIDYRINLLFEKLNNVLANTGLSVPSPGTTQVDGNLNVVGTENVSGNLNVTGSATIGGPTTITGLTTVSGANGIQSSNYVSGTSGWKFDGTSLEANTGVIGNGALANPVVPQSVWQGTTADFSLTPAWSDLVTVTLTVPTGVTSVQVLGFVRLVASNTTASKDYLYSDMYIGGTDCGGFSSPVAAGDVGTSYCSYARTITGLTAGSTVVLKARGSTGTGTWTPSGNVCQMAASVTWYR